MIVFHCCALLLAAAVSLWLEGTSYLNGTCTHIRAYEFKFFQGPVGERRLLSTQTATSGRGRAKQLLQNLNYMWKGGGDWGDNNWNLEIKLRLIWDTLSCSLASSDALNLLLLPHGSLRDFHTVSLSLLHLLREKSPQSEEYFRALFGISLGKRMVRL